MNAMTKAKLLDICLPAESLGRPDWSVLDGREFDELEDQWYLFGACCTYIKIGSEEAAKTMSELLNKATDLRLVVYGEEEDTA